MQKIIPNLWFDNQAEQAAKFYTSIFKNSRISKITHYGKAGYEIHRQSEGTVMLVEFWLEKQKFVALNGGPQFKFTEAISFVVKCKTQDEIDYYRKHLSKDGDPAAQQCGRLKDKFGISWQIIPTDLAKMMSKPTTKKAQRVMNTLLLMKKINIDDLKKMYNGA